MGRYFLLFFGYLLLANGITSNVAYHINGSDLAVFVGSTLISVGAVMLALAHSQDK